MYKLTHFNPGMIHQFAYYILTNLTFYCAFFFFLFIFKCVIFRIVAILPKTDSTVLIVTKHKGVYSGRLDGCTIKMALPFLTVESTINHADIRDGTKKKKTVTNDIHIYL